MDRTSRKPRIAVVLTSEPRDGGKYTYSVSIVDALASLKEEKYELFAFVGSRADWSSVLTARFSSRPIRRGVLGRIVRKAVLVLPRGHWLWRLLGPAIDPIQRTIRGLSPDLVFYPGNDPLAHESPFPSAVPIHDLMHRYERRFPEVSDRGVFEYRERHYRRLCKYARCILVDSEIGRKHVLESYAPDPGKIFVLPYVPARLFRSREPVEIMSHLKLQPGFVFYPAQFWKHKNHEAIVRALALIKANGRVVRAVFVGSDVNAKQDVLGLVKDLGLQNEITTLDFVTQTQLAALYETAGALVMPTFFGPTNIPPLEAFQLGCPVIVSDIYGMREQLGDAAVYVDPTDPSALAQAIISVLDDTAFRSLLIERGFKHAATWNKESFATRLQEIIDNVIGMTK